MSHDPKFAIEFLYVSLFFQERMKMKALFRNPNLTQSEAAASEATGSGGKLPRSRIGTETSLETSIDNTTCIDRSSFEEEDLFRGLESDDGGLTLATGGVAGGVEKVATPTASQQVGGAAASAAVGNNNKRSSARPSLSTNSSIDSAHSDDGGSLTHHR